MTHIVPEMIQRETLHIPTLCRDKVDVGGGHYIPGIARWSGDLQFQTTQYLDGRDLGAEVDFEFMGIRWRGVINSVADCSKLYQPSRHMKVGIRLRHENAVTINKPADRPGWDEKVEALGGRWYQDGSGTFVFSAGLYGPCFASGDPLVFGEQLRKELRRRFLEPVIEKYTLSRKCLDITTHSSGWDQFLPSDTLEITWRTESPKAFKLWVGSEITVNLFNHGKKTGTVATVKQCGDSWWVTLHVKEPLQAFNTDPASLRYGLPEGQPNCRCIATPVITKEKQMRNTKMNPGMKRFYVGSNQTTADWTHDTLAEAEKHAQDMIDTGDYEETFVVEIRSVARRQAQPIKVTKFKPAKGKK